MTSPSSIKRLYYTAFLYAEYTLRNIEMNNPELINFLKSYKAAIQEIAPQFDAGIILDSVLELECYLNSTEYDIELFYGACFKKYSLRPEFQNNKFRESVELIQDTIRENEIYPIFQKIVNLSLSEGVYITHLDSFRQKKYYYQSIPEDLPTSYFFQHIFFKNDSSFWGDGEHIKYQGPNHLVTKTDEQLVQEWEHFPGIKGISKEEYIHEYLSQRSLTVFIQPYDDDISLQKILDQIKIALIAFRLNTIESSLNNYSEYQCFIEQFFKKDLYREAKKEFEKKVLGLLLWDEHRRTSNFREAIEQVYDKYKIRINSRCPYTEPDNLEGCSRECMAANECDKKIQHMFEATKKSIFMKRIITSKE